MYNQADILRKAFASRALQEPEGVTITDMEAKGAKEIKKYKGFLPEGYGFVYIVNNEESATFKEKCHYTTFTGLTLLSPQ